MNISYLASHIIRKQLNLLVVEKVASASIVSKSSQSGIGLAHLELALKRDSVNGIKLLLKEPNGAFKYRITNNNMAIAKITRIGVFACGQILCISPNGLQASMA